MLCVISFTARGQSKVKTKDSVNMKTQIEGFYSWYVDMIKNEKLNEDFNPNFVRRDDGMTTLDFKKYKDGLRKYKFTEDFIESKIKEYKTCIDNLNKIPYDKFTQFEDLDDFESINCDFSNRYEWTGGMDPIENAELTILKTIDKRTVFGLVDFYFYPEGQKTKWHTQAKVTFKRKGKEWEIETLLIERR